MAANAFGDLIQRLISDLNGARRRKSVCLMNLRAKWRPPEGASGQDSRFGSNLRLTETRWRLAFLVDIEIAKRFGCAKEDLDDETFDDDRIRRNDSTAHAEGFG